MTAIGESCPSDFGCRKISVGRPFSNPQYCLRPDHRPEGDSISDPLRLWSPVHGPRDPSENPAGSPTPVSRPDPCFFPRDISIPHLDSGGRGRKFESSHPDQFFFIKLISCYLFGRYHELTLYLLPDFRLTSTNGNLPSPKTTHPRNPCLPECSAHEHCLGSAESLLAAHA